MPVAFSRSSPQNLKVRVCLQATVRIGADFVLSGASADSFGCWW